MTETGEDDEPERTAAEQRIIDMVAERTGREYAEEHAEGILVQARMVGEL